MLSMMTYQGCRVVSPESVTVNGLQFRSMPVTDRCVVILPSGRAAMGEDNRPYVYESVAAAIEDIPFMFLETR